MTLESKSLEAPNRAARTITWTILGVNAILLIISIPDYRVSIDSGYHISLARWYAAHGSAWWDHINVDLAAITYAQVGRTRLIAW